MFVLTKIKTRNITIYVKKIWKKSNIYLIKNYFKSLLVCEEHEKETFPLKNGHKGEVKCILK